MGPGSRSAIRAEEDIVACRRRTALSSTGRGASVAARRRRLDEQTEILLVEKGPYLSYAIHGPRKNAAACPTTLGGFATLSVDRSAPGRVPSGSGLATSSPR